MACLRDQEAAASAAESVMTRAAVSAEKMVNGEHPLQVALAGLEQVKKRLQLKLLRVMSAQNVLAELLAEGV
jgi:hypothetical protein